ncbi:hypothetical protein IKQ65_03915 [Candidatus Saccharibacteria bacterium]|nr:hypothetical protein [Candidatus Saccharibacteria bacterium]MBR6961294.1 hypothetical protein [Candidatus Saccharibacteria bacterium]
MHKKVEIKSGPKSAKELFDAKEKGEMLNFDTDKGKVEASIKEITHLPGSYGQWGIKAQIEGQTLIGRYNTRSGFGILS